MAWINTGACVKESYHLNSIAGIPQIADEYESGIRLDSDVVR
jgi:hypothetical protein